MRCRSTYPILNRDGLEVRFRNTHPSGGFCSIVKTPNGSEIIEEDHVCYINNIECWAEEYRYGGIVIEAVTNTQK